MEDSRYGKIYIVSTPIGNLQDITFRAIDTLKSVDLILAEDTRSTGTLLAHYNITGHEMLSFYEGNEEQRFPFIFKCLQEGKNIALVSESGTPLVSDPGYKLIHEFVKYGIQVVSIPGPTALISALAVSGLPTNAFLFLGFLPKKEGKAKNTLEQTKLALSTLETCKTVILYESPHRIVKTLKNINNTFGDIDVVIARELTKIYEEIRREKVSESIKHFTDTVPRGEFTLLFSPAE